MRASREVKQLRHEELGEAHACMMPRAEIKDGKGEDSRLKTTIPFF
jgi:hypothetical protein